MKVKFQQVFKDGEGNITIEGGSGGSCMPSDKYVDLTVGASATTYTAPADGWFTISKVAGRSPATLDYMMLTQMNTGQLVL